MATKLQNIDKLEAVAKSTDGTVRIDREKGTGQWTVALEWSNGGFEGKCWGRAKSLEGALEDFVGKASYGGLSIS